jgi:site-specific DNA-adenine methylase
MRYADTFTEHKRNYKLARACLVETIPDILDVQFTCGDYQSVETRADDVIFCDPPRFWRPTMQGYRSWATPFNWYTFWDWCRAQRGLVFVCMKECPADFVPIATFSARGNQPRPEMLFVARKHVAFLNLKKE